MSSLAFSCYFSPLYFKYFHSCERGVSNRILLVSWLIQNRYKVMVLNTWQNSYSYLLGLQDKDKYQQTQTDLVSN